MLNKEAVILNKVKKSSLAVLSVAAAVIMGVAAASAGKSKDSTSNGVAQPRNQAGLKSKINTVISSQSQKTGSEIISNGRGTGAAISLNSVNSETSVELNGQHIDIEENGVTERTISSGAGQTYIKIARHVGTHGSSNQTDLSVNATIEGSNSTSQINSYSHSSSWSGQ